MLSRRRLLHAIALVVGVSLAIVVLAAAANVPAPGPPVTLLPSGSSETLPGFHNSSLNGNFTCGSSRCGGPGELWFGFSVALQARLSGSLESGAPIDFWVGNTLGMTAACGLSNPPPPCASPVATGPPYLYQSPTPLRTIDFGQLEFNFGGPGSLLPAGSWGILLINWGDAPLQVSVSAEVTVTPTW